MATKTPLEEFNILQERKDAIESEMSELLQVLETQGVGMDGPLVDKEDYPRADIDVYSVRHARHRVKVLQNDHKAVMRCIEEHLYKVHAEAREKKLGEGLQEAHLEPSKSSEPQTSPFAEVDRVDPGSPAAQARLAVGDEIVQFGSVTSSNFVNLQTIGNIVQHSKGVGISVSVLRAGTVMRLTLTPQTWSGRGLLGCNIIPLSKR